MKRFQKKTMRLENIFNIKIFVIFISLMLIPSLVTTSHPPCGLYGAPTCQFLPAPPGHTPSCARPGKTYCEHADGYPTYLIKHLVHKWGFEARNIIIDESGEDFESVTYRFHDLSHFFDPATIFTPGSGSHIRHFKGYKYDIPQGLKNTFTVNPVYISKTSSPSSSSSDTDSTDLLIYSSLALPSDKEKSNYFSRGWNGSKVSFYNPADWLKRFARDLGKNDSDGLPDDKISPEIPEDEKEKYVEFLDLMRSKQVANETASSLNSTEVEITKEELEENVDLSERTYFDPYEVFGASPSDDAKRAKRQSPGRNTLCRTNSQFIMPQAALNSRGNWMYIVNEMNTARQLVKTETCASSTCSNLCQLPNNYNARCEQKYIQKRLVALNSNGQNLYTDTFWFPSCCICTISN